MRRNAGENQFKLVRRDTPDRRRRRAGRSRRAAEGDRQAARDRRVLGVARRQAGRLFDLHRRHRDRVAAGARRDDREGSRGADRRHPRQRRRDLAGGRQRLLLHAAAQGLGERRGDRALPRQPDVLSPPGVDRTRPRGVRPRRRPGGPDAAHGERRSLPVKGTKLVAAAVVDGVKREWSFYVAELAEVLDGKARWKRVFGEEAKIVGATVGGGWLYVKTSADAPRYKVLRLSLAAPRSRPRRDGDPVRRRRDRRTWARRGTRCTSPSARGR